MKLFSREATPEPFPRRSLVPGRWGLTVILVVGLALAAWVEATDGPIAGPGSDGTTYVVRDR